MAVTTSARKVARPALRQDPKPRHIDGSHMATLLDNTDPNRRYTFANPNDKTTGLNVYIGNGWLPEVHSEGGVRFKNGAITGKLGEPMKWMDYELVSIDESEFDRQRHQGSSGGIGWDGFDMILARVNDPKGREHTQGSGLSSRHVAEFKQESVDE